MSTIEVPNVLLVPGQGSFWAGMYSAYENIPELKDTFDLADQLAFQMNGKEMIEGRSLSNHANDTKEEDIALNTKIAQPLIITAAVGLIKYLKENGSFTTAYGHSLGELGALFAAGCISEEDAIRLSILRGYYSYEASQQVPGGMAALLNIPKDVRERFHFGDGEEVDDVVIATENTPDEFTISGPSTLVDGVVNEFKEAYKKASKGMAKKQRRQLPNAVRLKIAGGFHSWMMRPAQIQYRKELDKIHITVPKDMNYFSNHSHSYEGSPDVIREHHEEQLVHPVKFWMDIGRLVADGHLMIVESGPSTKLINGLKLQQVKGKLPAGLELVAAEEAILAMAA
jgi:[acyl-carrier-protein] S-malonyltransferase